MLVDVCMPDLDGFQLAAMIREHPRFQKTAIIFISAIHLTDIDRLRGYEMGAVDYVPVPVVPEVLRAKVRVFAELYRKTRQLERLNAELEQRVAARTAELEASTAQLRQSEERRSLALAAGNMGSWDWNPRHRRLHLGRRPIPHLRRRPKALRRHRRERSRADPSRRLATAASAAWSFCSRTQAHQNEFRVAAQRRGPLVHRHGGAEHRRRRPRHAHQRRHHRHHRPQGRRGAPGAAGARGRSSRQECAGARAVDRAPDARPATSPAYTTAVEGRIRALSRAHTILSQSRWQGADMRGLVEEELAPYRTGEPPRSRPRDRTCRCSRPPRRRWRWRCTSSPPTPPNTARCRRCRDACDLSWELNPARWCCAGRRAAARRRSAPSSPGFGTRIITASIEGQLGGQAVFDWRPRRAAMRALGSARRHDPGEGPQRPDAPDAQNPAADYAASRSPAIASWSSRTRRWSPWRFANRSMNWDFR